MKRLAIAIAAALILGSLACSQKEETTTEPAPSTQQTQPVVVSRTFSGSIMDSACAMMGTHEQMAKKAGAKNDKECTIKCVKMGSKYVLYDSTSKTTYQLEDQTKAEQFAGENVKVTGTLDEATKTIHVENITAA